ncbi:MAG: ArpU family phage packaging/lysis transcriptional regulator [Thermoactinomyces sp.]
MENQKEWEDRIVSPVSRYEEKTSPVYTGYNSTTERLVVEWRNKELRMEQIEKSMSLLTVPERRYIEEKYFNPRRPSDYDVCEELGMSRSQVSRMKLPALLKLATALNIPQAEECLTEMWEKQTG